jgi:outer membrane protein OmpA-like peptidoglycan-associated protein
MSNLKEIFGSTNKQSNNIWMTTSDLMSGLMMVFLFIAISYMVLETKSYSKALESQRAKLELVKALHKTFDKDLKDWCAEINDDDISIQFVCPEILFDPGKSSIKPEFQILLSKFYPRYLEVLSDFKEFIDEIRIEGHTSKGWKNKSKNASYLLNMELSQDRSRSVLSYVINMVGHKNPKELLLWARKRITANGLSSSNLYRKDGKYDPEKSRRVEFKIRTNAEERLDLILSE